MPILQGALLCDAAHDYGGLVSILGGFVNMTSAAELPALAPIWFAARVGFDEREIATPHEILVRAEDPSGATIAEIRGRFVPPSDPVRNPEPELALGLNLVFPFTIPIAAEGVHWVELRVDDEPALVRLPLKVKRHPPAP